MLSTGTLNSAQQRAVLHEAGPLLILAGAGSGKTRVITHRLAELVERGCDPKRILAVTFTNKAAGEMRQRAEVLMKGQGAGMWIGTFHALGARLLRRYAGVLGLRKDFVIFDDADQRAMCGQILKELDLSDYVATPRAILSGIDQAKTQGLTAAEYAGHDFLTDLVAKVYTRYEANLRKFGGVDFNDLLLLPLRLCESDATTAKILAGLFEHVLVDEFQDVNRIQYRLLCHFAKNSRQLVVVGDDDQAIYGWRGADVRNLLDFERDWSDATIIKLEQNYRSTQIILDAANSVISRNAERRGKQLVTDKQGGERIVYHRALDERREADFVAQTILRLVREEDYALSDFAVFYRINAQSRALEEAFRARTINYTVIGSTRFYDRAEVKDVMAYLRLCQNPDDEVALRRVINVPARGIGDTTIAKIEVRARATGATLWRGLNDILRGEGGITGTAHKKLSAFVSLIEELQQLRIRASLDVLAEAAVERTGYLERLSVDGGADSLTRRENVMELLGSIRECVKEADRMEREFGLADYLEQTSLASSSDTQTAGVAMMTVHAAKGLEFPIVFVTGLEDGLFPSLRRVEEHGEQGDPISEERRLAYVAITRARERLILTNAQHRRLFGQGPRPTEPSRFLREIPVTCLDPSYSVEEGRRVYSSTSISADEGLTYEVGESSSTEAMGYQVELDEGAFERSHHGDRTSTRDAQRAQGACSATRTEDALQIEYDDSGDARGAFRLGQKVHHDQFGEGVVRAFSGQGRQLKVIVYFPSIGAKTVMAGFLRVS